MPHPSKVALLRAACLPFVTRTFRGTRWRRTLVLTTVLALLSGLIGTWLAQGHGGFEREVRQELRIEPRIWERERTEYIIVVDDPWEYENQRRERSALIRRGIGPTEDFGQFHYLVREAAGTLVSATMTAAPAEHAELQSQAHTLLAQGARALWDEEDNGIQSC